MMRKRENERRRKLGRYEERKLMIRRDLCSLHLKYKQNEREGERKKKFRETEEERERKKMIKLYTYS